MLISLSLVSFVSVCSLSIILQDLRRRCALLAVRLGCSINAVALTAAHLVRLHVSRNTLFLGNPAQSRHDQVTTVSAGCTQCNAQLQAEFANLGRVTR